MKSRKELREKLASKDLSIVSDPFGSYTGRPEQLDEMPVQDADDL